MDVVLFNPAPRSGKQVHRRIELPLGLLCCATPLVRQGYRVQIVDAFADPNWRRALDEALDQRPICFGVTSMTGPQLLHALEGCRLARARHPALPIVWGGVHASLLPEQTLAHPLCDVVVVGEGEQTFPELVEALASGSPLGDVSGICYEGADGRPARTAPRPFVDLEQQPPLAYELVDVHRYRRRLFGVDHLSLNTSRGCVHRCGFCWDPVMHQRRWRAMSAESILEQMKRVRRDHGVRGFLFTDDNFFIDMRRARTVLETIVAEDLDLTISKLQVRVDRLCKMDPELLELMVRARVKRLTVGVESGSPRVLELIQKDITVEQALEANSRLARYPITPLYLFMMGLPRETPDDLAQTIRLAVRMTDDNPRAVKSFNIYTPYPGTPLFERCVELGLRPPRRLEDWAAFNFRNVPQGSWLSPRMRRLVAALDLPLMFIGKGTFVAPTEYKRTHPLVAAAARLYYPIARYRVTHLDARLPIETTLVKALGLFARQG